MDQEKVIALAKSSDISSVLLAFELNESLGLATPLNLIDERIKIMENCTLEVHVNTNRMFVRETGREYSQAEADEMRALLMDLNPHFYQFPFVEAFLTQRYNIDIVFTF